MNQTNKTKKQKTTDLGRRDFLALACTGVAGAMLAGGIGTASAAGTGSNSTSKTQLPNEEGPFDLVLEGGRVIDPETGLDAIRNVGIKDDKITSISQKALEGTKTLDATGMIVAPGFIDMHAHGQQLPAAWMQVFDGVTTALELESGLFPVGMAYDHIAKEGRPNNFGLGCAATFTRIVAFMPVFEKPDGTIEWFQKAFTRQVWQNDPPSDEQLEKILELTEAGLKDGALSVSVNAGYAPGTGRKEYFALSELAQKYGVSTHTHNRSMSVLEPASSFQSIVEQIGISASTGAHMHICHLNSTSNKDLKAATELIKEAQERGVNLTVEAYPYGAFSTVIGAEFMRGDMWLARFGGTDYGAVELRGKPLTKEKILELQKAAPGTAINFHFLDEENSEEDRKLLDLAVLYPGGSIASDGMPWMDAKGKILQGDIWPLPKDAFAHPRSAGCFSRFISRWVRERKAISLSEALAKTSLYPSSVLEKSVPEIKKKGRIQVGCDADILVFDFDTIKDNADFVNPNQVASGQKHVIVNGVPVIEDGQRMGSRRPGRPVRRKV